MIIYAFPSFLQDSKNKISMKNVTLFVTVVMR